MSSETVAQHYNAVRQDGIAGRAESRIFYLRNLNNWIKSELINEAMHLLRNEAVNKMFRPRVLDLACGKGGDLRKWKIANVDSVVMADVAEVSLSQAKERYNEMAERERGLFPAEFVHSDCCKDNLKSQITSHPEFDLISCQFALHYSFIDEQSARTFLRNATETLRPGGFLIGTLPDAERIVWAVQQNDGEFKNAVCSVQYDNKDEMKNPPLFGAKFHFTLDSQVNCPEFLAYFPLVKHLLEELDMELVFMRRFPEALQHWKSTGAGLLARMQALEPYPSRNGAKLSGEDIEYEQAEEFVKKLDASENPTVGTLSKSEWEAFCMYLVFAFRKKGGTRESGSSEGGPRKSDEAPEVKRARTEEDDEETTS
ncbi:hypothetical protein RB195_006719 [Necator americanus]|uniref:mRNA cap guanine-N(7) methyltransferase n=1 Tax=Necator americanus TaxID=51031 RepID=A0ABR1BTW2_NECAM